MEFYLAHTYCGISFGHTLPIRPTILSYLADHACTHGDDPFITAVSAEDHVVTLSYRELDVLSRRLACWLRRDLQVRSGDVLALLPANDVTSVVAIFGLLRSGCAVLLLNPADPVGRLQQQTEALRVKVVLRIPTVSADFLPDAILAPNASALDEESINDLDPPIEPSDDALFFGTSGSTAASKLVAQSHYNVAVNAEAVRRHHGLRRGDRLLGCLPIYHVNSLHFTIFATLASGAHAILAHGFDPFGYPRLIEQFRPRIASVVPSILEALLGTWRQPIFPSEFNYFVSAAAPLTTRTAREVAQKMNVRVLQGYGLTETTNFSTTMPTDLPQEAYQRLMLDAEIPSIGTAFYGNEVAVLTADGDRAAPGEIGEICMRGHNVMMRYAGNAAETAEAFRDGWFHSKDLGFEIEDGESGSSFFIITGRIKNIAKVRGETVSLDEMDRVLRALPHVLDAACVSLPHRFIGDEIIAAVVFSEDARHTDLRTHLRATFAATALPSRIVRLDAIPRTATGKILRAELAQKLASLGDEEATQ
jgi:acyl-CoA synthetase (AMP-forming)/AMP-acid ligase II